MHVIEIFCCYCREKEVKDISRINNLIKSIDFLNQKYKSLKVNINIFDDSKDAILMNSLNEYKKFSSKIKVFSNNNQGKFIGIKKFLQIVSKNSLLIFTDANTYFCVDSIYQIYKQSKKNNHKKLVSGRLIHLEKSEFEKFGKNSYSKTFLKIKSRNRSTNNFLKNIENSLNTSAGVNGAFYLVPFFDQNIKKLIKKDEIQNDDFYISTLIADKYGFSFANNAIVFEESPCSFRKEIVSKYRDSRGHFYTAKHLLKEPLKPITKILIIYRLILWNSPLFILAFSILFLNTKLVSTIFLPISIVIFLIFFPLKFLIMITAFLGFWIGLIKGQLIKW